MPRPSKKAQRTEEILDAYERCVIRFGVDGATLQRVADESGLARPLLHHNIGNRDDLFQALLARMDQRSRAAAAQLWQHLPESGRCEAMLDLLFDARHASSGHDVLLYQAVQLVASRREDARRVLVDWYEGLLEDIRRELQQQFPTTAPGVARAVATGIVALYFNADSMAQLTAKSDHFDDARRAASLLLETLSWNGS